MAPQKAPPPQELRKEMDAPVLGLAVQATHRRGIATGALFERHWHDHLQLMRVRKGHLRMWCRSGAVEIAPGEVLVLHPGEIHFSENCQDPRRLFDFDVVKMDFAFLESARVDACQLNILEPLRTGRLVFRSLVRDSQVSAHVSELVQEAARREQGFELALKGASLSLLSLLVRRHVEATLSTAEAARRNSQQERLGAVLSRLEESFRDDIPLTELAQLAGLCESHFCRVFRTLTGHSPVEYRNRLRIGAAREQLFTTSRPVETIAFECGFQDPNYFSRVFHKLEGSSPSEFRKRKSGEMRA